MRNAVVLARSVAPGILAAAVIGLAVVGAAFLWWWIA